MRHKKILSACFGVSLFLHMCALLCFQKYSLWFSSPQIATRAENWLEYVDKKMRDQILQTAFDPLGKESTHEEILMPSHEKESLLAFEPKMKQDLFDLKNPTQFQLSFPEQEPLLANQVLPTFSMPNQTFNLLDHLPKDLIVPIQTPAYKPIFLPMQAKTSLNLTSKPAIFDENPTNHIFYSDELDLSLANAPHIGKVIAPIQMPSLSKLPTLEDLETASYSDSFDADLVFLPKEEGKGYIFALTLIPRPDLNLPKLSQHITFLIDRSNSIQQERLNATKSAVLKALSSLNSEDTFNIIAFDSKIDKMSPHYLPCTKKSFVAAEKFLEKIQLGSFFSSSDLYKPLFLTVPGLVKQDEIYTTILLTDGDTLRKKTTQRSLFSDWTAYNSGKVALFALGLNDANLATLDAITVFNKGKLINSPSFRGFKRKLLKLLKNIQTPIAKNISCHAISRAAKGKIELFPKSSQMPHLYQDQPYVILGETSTLDDFILFVQGRLKNRWLNIKKTISFINARKGNKTLAQEFALQQAYLLYDKFIIDENPKHIAEAKELLEPFDISIAFQ